MIPFRVNPKKLWGIQTRVASFCAAEVQLKDFAQRAFVAYIKSVFLMKDKKVFDVSKLDTDAYARYVVIFYDTTFEPNQLQMLKLSGRLISVNPLMVLRVREVGSPAKTTSYRPADRHLSKNFSPLGGPVLLTNAISQMI